jgi:hypothetical protein
MGKEVQGVGFWSKKVALYIVIFSLILIKFVESTSTKHFKPEIHVPLFPSLQFLYVNVYPSQYFIECMIFSI